MYASRYYSQKLSLHIQNKIFLFCTKIVNKLYLYVCMYALITNFTLYLQQQICQRRRWVYICSLCVCTSIMHIHMYGVHAIYMSTLHERKNTPKLPTIHTKIVQLASPTLQHLRKFHSDILSASNTIRFGEKLIKHNAYHIFLYSQLIIIVLSCACG